MAGLTYAAFHLVFVLPALTAVGAASVHTADRRGRPAGSEVRPLAVALIVAVALAYTTPWDNYLVARGVWTYGADAVLGRVWHAPVEEYLFVVLQALLVAGWLAVVSSAEASDAAPVRVTRGDRIAGAGVGLLVGGVGAALLARPSTFYLGAILAWAGPVLALQWAVGWPYLVARRRTVALGIGVPTAYLCLIDAVAIRAGVWTLTDRFLVGLSLWGLPLEEAVFFLTTSAFVVQGLLLYPWVIERWR